MYHYWFIIFFKNHLKIRFTTKLTKIERYSVIGITDFVKMKVATFLQFSQNN